MRAVKGVDLEIADEEFVVLVGPSGCGKTTLLRMIAGLEEITAGDDPDRRPGRQRPAAEGPRHRDGVPELRALSAHDVHENMAFGAEAAAQRRRARSSGGRPRRRASWASSRPARSQAASSSRAASASAWRWAARSCAIRRSSCSTSRCRTSTPSCACRCAPRSSELHQRCTTTTIYVTHDQVEAMTMGDRIVVMQRWRVAAGRHAARALRRAGQPVRRRLHRHAADELRRGHDGRGQPGVTSRRDRGPAASRSGRRTRRRSPRDQRPQARAPGMLAGAPGAGRRRGRALGFEAARRGGRAARLGDPARSRGSAGPASPLARVPAETVIARGDQVRLSGQAGRLHFFDPETELPISG